MRLRPNHLLSPGDARGDRYPELGKCIAHTGRFHAFSPSAACARGRDPPRGLLRINPGVLGVSLNLLDLLLLEEGVVAVQRAVDIKNHRCDTFWQVVGLHERREYHRRRPNRYIAAVNVEFHYYAVWYLAEQAGFSREDARTIAYSSQYTDNALLPYLIAVDPAQNPHGGAEYQTLATHHFGFWDKSQEWQVWIPFHFFPAGPEADGPSRTDGGRNPLNVVAGSQRVKRLLIAALETRNLYRVGIALHTYADSWAHQNFTGRNETWNSVDRRSPLPSIGHAHRLRDPDDIDAVWNDPRLDGEAATADNRARFLAAAGKIYRYLATYNRNSFADEELVLDKLSELLGERGRKSADERMNDFTIFADVDPYRALDWREEAFVVDQFDIELAEGMGERARSTWDKISWLKDELLHKSKLLERRRRTGRPGFFASNLYRWDQAARAHLGDAVEILADLV